MIGAAVDVGSNSVHLLVARVIGDQVDHLLDESEQLGLGDIVDSEAAIPDDAEQVLIHALSTYRDLAKLRGAASVTFLGTEPFRHAANGADVAQRLERDVGVPFHVLSKQEEGELTFLGVTRGIAPAGEEIVVDIGGGSTEVVIYRPLMGLLVTGLPTGSNRLSNGYIRHDPPTRTEIDRLRRAAQGMVEELPADQPERGVFVGGTATNIVKLSPLHEDSFETLYGQIRSAPAAVIAERFGLRLRRAFQLAAGAALAEALLDRFGLSSADVSEASLRDGAILAAARR